MCANTVSTLYLCADHSSHLSDNPLNSSLHVNSRVDMTVHILMFTPRFSFQTGLNFSKSGHICAAT